MPHLVHPLRGDFAFFTLEGLNPLRPLYSFFKSHQTLVYSFSKLHQALVYSIFKLHQALEYIYLPLQANPLDDLSCLLNFLAAIIEETFNPQQFLVYYFFKIHQALVYPFLKLHQALEYYRLSRHLSVYLSLQIVQQKWNATTRQNFNKVSLYLRDTKLF